MSLFVWYFGTRRKYATCRTTRSCSARATGNCSRTSSSARSSRTTFSLYLHRPTATDPSLAPPGCDAFYVLSPVPHLRAARRLAARRPNNTAALSQASSARRCCRILKANIVTSRMLTPQDFQDRLSSFRGAAFGLEPILTQSAWFRPHNRSEDIDRLLPGRCRHASRRGPAGRAVFGASSRHGGSPMPSSPGLNPFMRRATRTSPSAARCCTADRVAFPPPRMLLPRSPFAIPRSRSTRFAGWRMTRSISAAAIAAPLAIARNGWNWLYARPPLDHPADRALRGRRRAFRDPARLARSACSKALPGTPRAAVTTTSPDLYAYAARVAGTVGAMMTLVMGLRAPKCSRAPAISASRCSSPISPATSARMRAPAGSICRFHG